MDIRGKNGLSHELSPKKKTKQKQNKTKQNKTKQNNENKKQKTPSAMLFFPSFLENEQCQTREFFFIVFLAHFVFPLRSQFKKKNFLASEKKKKKKKKPKIGLGAWSYAAKVSPHTYARELVR